MAQRFDRVKETSTNTRAGCRDCSGEAVRWSSKNAQAVAARHTSMTGHHTWVEVELTIQYLTPECTEQSKTDHEPDTAHGMDALDSDASAS